MTSSVTAGSPSAPWNHRGRTGTSRADGGARPGAGRADHLARLRLVVHRLRGRGRPGPAAAADLLLRAQLRLPDGGRRLRRGVGPAGCAHDGGGARGPLRLGCDQRRGGRQGRVRPVASTARRSASCTSCAPTSCARRCWLGTDLVCRAARRGGQLEPSALAALTLGQAAAVRRAGPAAAAPGRAGPARRRRRPAADRPGHRRAAAAPTRCRCTCAGRTPRGSASEANSQHLPRHAAAPVRPHQD